jgi:hypothetical protein
MRCGPLGARGTAGHVPLREHRVDRDEPVAHAAFVGSPGHVGNLIDAKVRRVGVAVVTAGDAETSHVRDFAARFGVPKSKFAKRPKGK